MSAPIVGMEGVAFAYPGGRRVFTDASFHLREDEHVGLVGPNGSGKTTFFGLLMGLIKPQAGRVLFLGREPSAKEELRRLRTSVGYVFQDAEDQLFSPTVLEDVAFGPLNQGLDVDAARQRATEALELVGLEGFEDRLTHRLSGGEKRLAALASVLAMRPKALLLDEPANALDPSTRERLIEVLGRLALPGVTISHDWDFLARTATCYATIEAGRVVRDPEMETHTHSHAHPAGGVRHRHG